MDRLKQPRILQRKKIAMELIAKINWLALFCGMLAGTILGNVLWYAGEYIVRKIKKNNHDKRINGRGNK